MGHIAKQNHGISVTDISSADVAATDIATRDISSIDNSSAERSLQNSVPFYNSVPLNNTVPFNNKGNLVASNDSVVVSDKESAYRKMVFSVLKQLKDAQLEIVEGQTRNKFGELSGYSSNDNHSSDENHSSNDSPSSSMLSATILVHDDSFYKDVVTGGSIGAAEAYIDGKWSSPQLTRVIQIMARNQSQLDELDSKTRWINKISNFLLQRRNSNSKQGSKRNILAHYDIGNELYQGFLDPAMQYSSAIYAQGASTLEEAQQQKMAIICQRLELSEQDHVIEIGTGWGGLAIYMAQTTGCKVTTTTISDQQHDYTQQKIKQLGLEDRITLLKQDYRELKGQYDKLVSIEMIEAVGHDYLNSFFTTCSNLLKPTGKMLIQSITIADARYDKYRKGTDFIQKYIFPGGCLPSIAVISNQMAKNTDMVVEQIDDIGLHYARTLNDWDKRFLKHWPQLENCQSGSSQQQYNPSQREYNQSFKRLWHFYFCYCEGAFIERVISTHHIVARKPRFVGAEHETVLDY